MNKIIAFYNSIPTAVYFNRHSSFSSEYPIISLPLFYMQSFLCACRVKVSTAFLCKDLTLVLVFSGQIKRLEEHKVEQDKQLKAISKQMKVRFLSKNFSANALKVDRKLVYG